MSPYESDLPLRPQPGSTLDPSNAVGRVRVTKQARDHINGGNNLSLTDPRRMGKTVWLSMFAADPGDGIAVVRIDYEGVSTADEFLSRTFQALRGHASIPKRAAERLAAVFDGWDVKVGPLSVKVGVAQRSPIELLSDLLGSVDDGLDPAELLVVLMDEVPIAIKNVAEREGASTADTLLQALRQLRTRPDSRLRWVVCGSVGFHHVLRYCGATEGAVNDLINLPLGPLDEPEANELARRLLLGIERAGDPAAADALVQQSGAIPFLIHALAQRLHDSGEGMATATDVEVAFQDFIDDRDSSGAVTHLVTRLDPNYGESAEGAAKLLDRIAVERSAASASFEGPQTLLDDLIDDHYLLERQGNLTWRYEVLRRIWVHRRRLA